MLRVHRLMKTALHHVKTVLNHIPCHPLLAKIVIVIRSILAKIVIVIRSIIDIEVEILGVEDTADEKNLDE